MTEEERFDEEFHRHELRLQEIETQLTVLTVARRDEVVLASPNGRFRVELSLKDEGELSLLATLSVRDEKTGDWITVAPSRGVQRLAQWDAPMKFVW